jgi:hypothetical protein
MLEMLVRNGLSQDTLLGLLAQNTVGFPVGIDAARVRKYFKDFGSHPHDIQASMATTRLDIRHDVKAPTLPVIKPGHTFQIDQFNPKYASKPKRKQKHRSGEMIPAPDPSHQVYPALGSGATIAIACIDPVSGVLELFTYKTLNDPEKVVVDAARFGNTTFGRSPSVIVADATFVTAAARTFCADYVPPIRIIQPQVNDHRRISGPIEGAIRWLEQAGQGNMNRLKPLVKLNVITAD